MMTSYVIQQLGSMLNPKINQKLLEQRLKEFCCSRDTQLEDFIHNKAIAYEAKGFSRIFIILDTATSKENEMPKIAAFFALAITATNYDNISRSRKEKVLGSKPGRNTFKAFPGILIAQLARDDRYESEYIDGESLLRECEHYIELGRQYLGGRNIYLDCKKMLIKTYTKNGYRLLSDSSTPDGYYKMYKVLPENEIT